MNVICLLGRLTRDPERKETESGKVIARFTLAVQRNKDQADFIDCQAWEKTAGVALEYLKKGDQCAVQGRLQIRPYETDDGQKRKAVTVQVSQLRLVGGKRDTSEDDGEEAIPF